MYSDTMVVMSFINLFFFASIVALYLIGAVIGANEAKRKGRGAGLWFFLCLLCPVFLIVICTISKGDFDIPLHKKCSYCAEWIKEEAKVCKHCGRDV